MTATCRREPRQPTELESLPGPQTTTRLVVDWAGCAGIRQGPVCELGAQRTLTIWVAGSRRARWDLVTDAGSVPAKVEDDIDDGVRLTVEVPARSRRIEIRDPRGRVEWRLAVREAKTHDEIDRLLALGRTGRYADALAGLEAYRARAPADDLGPADAAIARTALALGKLDRAEFALSASIAAAKTEGRISDVVRDAAALTWTLIMLEQRYVEARSVLQDMKTAGEQYPEGSVWIAYHAGLLAAQTGDVRTALENYRLAERMGRRLQRATLTEDASMEVARLLTAVGRFDEALVLLRALPIPTEACARATLALNVASVLTDRATRLGSRQSDQEVTTALAAAQNTTRVCPDPHRRMLALVTQAEYSLAVNNDRETSRIVQAMKATPLERAVREASWRADVFGRWLLRQSKPALALDTFDEQVRVARSGGLSEEEFRGQVGAGRALLAMRRRGEAVSRLKAAQNLLEKMLREIPLGEGRGSFLDGHDDGVRTLVGALVEGCASREAMRVSRWARAVELVQAARLDRLSSLSADARRRWDESIGRYQRIRKEIEHESENDWTIARAVLSRLRAERQARAEQARAALDEAYRVLVGDRGAADQELSEPGAGEVYLAFFPAAAGWYAFGATSKTVAVYRLSEARFSSPAEAGKALALFDRELAAARRVRLFPYGASNRVDWHVAPWAGRPLVASIDVEYGLDIPSRTRERQAAPPKQTALLVANPTGDLPGATREADLIAQALSSWRVVRFDGETATRNALLEGLSHAGLFHYAGHAEIQSSQGLASALLLAGNARVELGDLLAVPSVPDLVALSACDAAGTAPRHPSLLGLAQAFIASGSRAVVAPVRPVSDSASQVFFGAFYSSVAGARGDPNTVFRAAFRSAVMEVSQSKDIGESGGKDVAGWESFRLLVP